MTHIALTTVFHARPRDVVQDHQPDPLDQPGQVHFLELVHRHPLVPVLRARSGDLLVEVGHALAQAGVQAIELTATTPGAHEALAHLRSQLPAQVMIGMGTLLTATGAQDAISAGADFLVTPCVLPEVAEAATAAGVAFAIGALTPTEVLQAWALHPALVKVFPAGSAGPSHVRALRDVYPDVPLLPTGGITPDTAPEYLRAGAAGVGLGGNLLSAALRGEGDLSALQVQAAALLTTLLSTERPASPPSGAEHSATDDSRTDHSGDAGVRAGGLPA